MRIRDAEVKDARQIAQVHVASWQAAYRGLIPDHVLDDLSIEQREAFWAGILSNDPRSTLVLLDKDSVVGWAAFGPARDPDCDPARVQELYGIYLLPEHWGVGHGKRLHREIENRILDTNASAVVLWVLEKNFRARKFYEAIGYRLEPGSAREKSLGGINLVGLRYRKVRPRGTRPALKTVATT